MHQQRDQVLQQLRANLSKAQARMKRLADTKRTEINYAVGELVFVKLHPYKQSSVTSRRHPKLTMRYYGPFPIIQKLGSVAYKLQLPTDARIHPVFHVSKLKKCHGPNQQPCLSLPLLTNDWGPIIQPDLLLQLR